MRIFLLFFTIFGLMVALPVVVWDITSRNFFVPIAILLTFLAAFVPIGLIAWFNIEDDPNDGEVPYRIRTDASVRASIVTGILLGIGAIIWLML